MILTVADPSQVAASRRAASELARRDGLDEERSGAVALIVTELATNLLKHAARGELIVQRYADASGEGIELLGLDKGPGIADLANALRDGHSTAGSPGTGLGAMRRQADIFEVFSRPGHGTAVLARVRNPKLPARSASPVIGAVIAPYPGEEVSGDAWAFGFGGERPTLMMADGAGHGALAHEAAIAAVSSFTKGLDENVTQLVEDIHRALAPTRGAAVAVAQADRRHNLVRFVGVGNISAAMITAGGVRRMVSHNGTAGHVAARIREFTYPWDGQGTIVLHSDGLGSRWDLEQYPGLASSHPSLIAGVLYRDFRRARDDAAVVAMRF